MSWVRAMYLEKPSASFSPIQNGAILSRYAELAYTPNKSLAVDGWESVDQWSHEGAHGFVCFSHPVKEPPTIVVAIAGTDDWLDMRHDLNIQASRLASGPSVHRGFAAHCEHVVLGLKPFRSLWSKDGANLWVVGHSLGGAAAVVLPLLATLPKACHVVTYGAPPAIAQGFGATYMGRVTRCAP